MKKNKVVFLFIFIMAILIATLIVVCYKNSVINNELKSKIERLQSELDKTNEDNVNSILNKSEIQRVLGADDAIFCIENIQKAEDEYIISATMLEKNPRVISALDIKDLRDGKEIEFREQKWKLKNETEDFIEIQSGDDALMIDKNTETLINVAGVVRDLCDYSSHKIKFKVSKDILIGTFWSNFKYDENGHIKACGMENTEEEIVDYKGISFEQLLEFSKGCRGTYDECRAYVKDGVVGAIRISWK